MGPGGFGNPSGGAVPMTLHQIVDRQHRNVIACIFEYPAEWQARSQVTWNFQNISVPVQCFAQAFDPQSAACVEFLPGEAFCWVEPNYGMCQPGQSSMGQTMMPLMSAADALTRWVVPKFRGNRMGMRIVRAVPAPFTRQMGIDMRGAQAEEAAAGIEYSENGSLLEEEIYGVKVQNSVPYYGPQGAMTQINWGFIRLFSFRAEKGRLDTLRPLLGRIASSIKVNPAWEQLLGQIMQQLAAQFNQYIQMGYSQIQAAGQMSQAISANNDAMLSMFAHQRQAAHHSSASHTAPSRSPNDNFSDYIRGVETVEDTYWGESQQDSNYQYHWTDGYGNYQHTDDPFFNPSIGSDRNWTLMQPKR